MTKLIFLGSGSAFTIGVDNFQSNMLLVSDQRNKLLIDCGSDIRFSLYKAGFSHLDITDIYISHIHSDHTGGLEDIGFNTKFDSRCNKPNLYLSFFFFRQKEVIFPADSSDFVDGDRLFNPFRGYLLLRVNFHD